MTLTRARLSDISEEGELAVLLCMQLVDIRFAHACFCDKLYVTTIWLRCLNMGMALLNSMTARANILRIP
jgi:hypothetical protein